MVIKMYGYWIIWEHYCDDVTNISVNFCSEKEEVIEFINQERFKEEKQPDLEFEYEKVLMVFKGEKFNISKEEVKVVEKYGLSPV